MNPALQYRRLVLLGTVLVAAFFALIVRFFLLQILWHDALETRADSFTRARKLIQPWRGEIRDRNGQPLAWSVPVVDVYADLVVCKDHVDRVVSVIGPLLGIEPRRLVKSMYEGLSVRNGGPKDAVLLKRNVTLAQWTAVLQGMTNSNFGMDTKRLTRRERGLLENLRRRALFARETQMRDYLFDDVLAHVIGPLAAASDKPVPEGLAGVELRFNSVLSGTPGYCFSRKDARGTELPFHRYDKVDPTNGASIALTIDLQIQRIAEAALSDAVARTGAKCGGIIVMDPKTGEVLALASRPAFSLRNPQTASPDLWRHHPISTQYEPGSTFKVITLVSALDLGLLTLDHRVDCERGYWSPVRLHDHKPFSILTIREALAHSSDIGFAKVAMLIGAERLYNYVTNFGFDRPTGIPLPGEVGGYVPHWKKWTEHGNHLLARIAFGQGLRVTQLQMTVAYCAVVNGGHLMRPILVKEIENADGTKLETTVPFLVRSVIRPETSSMAREALTLVCQPGFTGSRASLTYWTCGGKTSTAEKSTSRGYIHGAFYCGFIGHAPADDPRIVISVALDEPGTPSPSGGAVAAPLFRAVAERVLPYLGVPMDKGQRQNEHGLQLAGSNTQNKASRAHNLP